MSHIYPTWVSEGTCSTKCVDIRGEEEFCVATSVCEHSTWRKAFDRHKAGTNELATYETTTSISSCEVWGDLNRCDGTLCDVDHECQSGCCGAFVSFTHHRCLPILGDYCPGRDTTRHRSPSKSHTANSIEGYEDSIVHDLLSHAKDENIKNEKDQQKEHLAQQVNDRSSNSDIEEVVSEII